jgi:hypothetical protein
VLAANSWARSSAASRGGSATGGPLARPATPSARRWSRPKDGMVLPTKLVGTLHSFRQSLNCRAGATISPSSITARSRRFWPPKPTRYLIGPRRRLPSPPRPTCELRAEVYRRRPVIGAPASERTCTIGDLALAVSEGRKWGCIYAERAAIDDALTEDRTPAKSDIIGHVRGPETEPVPLPDLGISRWRRLGAGCAPP